MEAMYALVKTGGKQYRVAKDDKILVERIAADEGAEIILDDIIMLGDGDKVTVGTPRVEGAAVSAKVVSQTRGPKIIIFRRKRRKNHRRTQGHRQDLTLLQITAIAEDGKALKPKSAPAKKAAPKQRPLKPHQSRQRRRQRQSRQRRRQRRRKLPPRQQPQKSDGQKGHRQESGRKEVIRREGNGPV
jgi:large subunit ribosomal protein L21